MATKPPPPRVQRPAPGKLQAAAEAVYGPPHTETNGPRFAVVAGRIDGPQRVLLYGPGGIGKSTLASLAPNPVFIDLESGSNRLDVPRVSGINSWSDLRACLQSSALDPFETVVLDSATRAEEWAVNDTLGRVRNERNEPVNTIEGYGFGKGYQHVYDTYLHLLQDCDSQIRRGRNVVLIAHDCTTDVPNPTGENFIRYEPHLQTNKSGKASIRERVFQWSDHVLFLAYDVAAKKGKGIGGGTRTIYTSELPSHRAKSRDDVENMVYDNAQDGAIWSLILGGAK